MINGNKKDIVGIEDFLWACALTDRMLTEEHRTSSTFSNDFEVKRHRIMESKTTLVDENIKESFIEVDIFESKSDQMDSISDSVWEAALILCTVMSRKIRSIDGFNILELGCGVGLSGFFVAKSALAQSYCSVMTLSDFDSSVLENLVDQIDKNFEYLPVENDIGNFFDTYTVDGQPRLDICLELIDWLNFSFPPLQTCESDDDDIGRKKNRKWIMGSALCYMQQHEALADVIYHYISRMGVEEAVLVQIRDREGLKECLARLTLLGLKVTVSDVCPEIFDSTTAAVYCRTVEHDYKGISHNYNGNRDKDSGGDVTIRVRKRYLFHLPSLWGDVAQPLPTLLPEGVETSSDPRKGSSSSSPYKNNLLTTDRAAFVIVSVTPT